MKRDSGLTLLEVLIGLVILAFITSMLAQASWITSRGKRTIEQREVAFHEARVALQRMVDDISMAFIAQPQLNALGRDASAFQTGFVGTEETLDFTSFVGRRLVAGEMASDQVEIGYALEARNDTDHVSGRVIAHGARKLVRREDRVLDSDMKSGGEKLTLAEGVEKLTFEYYLPKDGEWKKEWDSTSRATLNQLPRAVRLTLTVPHPTNPSAEPLTLTTIAFIEMGPDPVSVQVKSSATTAAAATTTTTTTSSSTAGQSTTDTTGGNTTGGTGASSTTSTTQ